MITVSGKNINRLLSLLEQDQIICITGQMAAGKNYISSKLEEAGWLSVDADKLVHKAIEQSTEKIIRTFKTEADKNNINLMNPDGSLNRRELGRLLFPSPELLKKQEEIIHPAVTLLTKEFIAANPGKKIIINATVLYQTPHLMRMCSKILFVKAGKIKRLIRSRKRDHMPIRQILKRFSSQKDLLNKYISENKEIIIINN